MSSDAPDEFFLNFGSSSNVCDQLRHSIRQEISDIDASIAKVEEESAKERRTSQELCRSLSHARNEMHNLSRGSADICDSTTMNETLRRRMMDDIQTELVHQYLVKGKKTNDESNDRENPSSPISVTFLEERQEEIKVFEATKSKFKADTMVLMTKKRELEDAKASIEQLMETEQLSEKFKLAEDEVKKLEEELEKEQRRGRITKEAIHEARTKTGMHAQEIADFTNTLTTKKAKHEKERKELAQLLAKEEEELAQLSKDDGIEKQTQEMAHRLEILKKQISDSHAARKRREDVVAHRLVIENEIAHFEETIAKNDEELQKRREDVAAAQKAFQEAKALEEQAAAQKAHNDHIETEKIIPGEQESQELQKEKESLAQSINECHSARETTLKELSEKDQEMTATFEKLELEVKTRLEESESELDALNRIKDNRQELQEATDRECMENEKLANQLMEACNAEKTRKRELELAMENNRATKLEEARIKSSQRREEQEELLQVMVRGAEMIKEVRGEQLELERLQVAHDRLLEEQ